MLQITECPPIGALLGAEAVGEIISRGSPPSGFPEESVGTGGAIRRPPTSARASPRSTWAIGWPDLPAILDAGGGGLVEAWAGKCRFLFPAFLIREPLRHLPINWESVRKLAYPILPSNSALLHHLVDRNSFKHPRRRPYPSRGSRAPFGLCRI